MFKRRKYFGRRTGVNVMPDQDIRTDVNGVELFDDYFTDKEQSTVGEKSRSKLPIPTPEDTDNRKADAVNVFKSMSPSYPPGPSSVKTKSSFLGGLEYVSSAAKPSTSSETIIQVSTEREKLKVASPSPGVLKKSWSQKNTDEWWIPVSTVPGEAPVSRNFPRGSSGSTPDVASGGVFKNSISRRSIAFEDEVVSSTPMSVKRNLVTKITPSATSPKLGSPIAHSLQKNRSPNKSKVSSRKDPDGADVTLKGRVVEPNYGEALELAPKISRRSQSSQSTSRSEREQAQENCNPSRSKSHLTPVVLSFSQENEPSEVKQQLKQSVSLWQLKFSHRSPAKKVGDQAAEGKRGEAGLPSNVSAVDEKVKPPSQTLATPMRTSRKSFKEALKAASAVEKRESPNNKSKARPKGKKRQDMGGAAATILRRKKIEEKRRSKGTPMKRVKRRILNSSGETDVAGPSNIQSKVSKPNDPITLKKKSRNAKSTARIKTKKTKFISEPESTGSGCPKPTENDEPNQLRRSSRRRFPVLEHWRNQRPIYHVSDSGGYSIVSVDEGFTPEPFSLRGNRYKRNAEKARKKLPVVIEVSESENDNCPVAAARPTERVGIEVINPVKNEEVVVDCVAVRESYVFGGPDGSAASDGHPFVMLKTLREKIFSSGLLILRPNEEKGQHYLETDTIVFWVTRGVVEVTIHKTKCTLSKKDCFYVPCGNTYNIKNLLHDQPSELIFFQQKAL